MNSTVLGKRLQIYTKIPATLETLDYIGSWGGIRTPDQVVNSHPLCRLSYPGTDYFYIK